MPYRDLRDWLERLERENELLRIKEEISLEPDVGSIGDAICSIEGPGIFAERLTGVKTPLTIGLHASFRRTAMAMDLPKHATRRQQVNAWIDAYGRYPVKAKVVSDAPCKENILTGESVNLFQFPIPRIHANDASFYISKPMCITKDPESDWVNVGMHRMMVLDKSKTTVFAVSAAQHFRYHLRRYLALGKPMEMAVALGTEPVLPMIAGMKIPAGWNEYDYAGAVRKEPLELVRGESVDLPVPARAEIILEGIVRTDEQILEGPFAEHPGCYSGCSWSPVFEIQAITHRNNPIYDCLLVGNKPYNESIYMTMLSVIGGVQQEIKTMLPQVTELAYHLPYLYNVVVQGKWGHTGEPKRAMNALWASRYGVQMKMITVVDEDIDPWDEKQVLWAIAARCQANKDVVIIPGTEGALDPSKDSDDSSCKLGIDATKSRPPFYRHKPVHWVEPGEKMEDWKEKILQLWEKGRR